MFVLKQWVGAWLMPLPIAALLLAAGCLLKALGRRRLAITSFVLSAAAGLPAALGSVGNGLLHPLETRYPAVVDAAALAGSPRYIVVLGSSYRPRDDLPVTSALDSVSLVRLVEGVRLFRQLPGSLLVVSGGAVAGNPPVALGYARAAVELGVPAESILRMDDVLDTSVEIRTLHQRVGGSTVLLVTSAAHMPRAMEYCARYGVRAIAAPTGHLAEPFSAWTSRTWLLPSATQLRKTEMALHEYLGLLALRLSLN